MCTREAFEMSCPTTRILPSREGAGLQEVSTKVLQLLPSLSHPVCGHCLVSPGSVVRAARSDAGCAHTSGKRSKGSYEKHWIQTLHFEGLRSKEDVHMHAGLPGQPALAEEGLVTAVQRHTNTYSSLNDVS